MVHRAKNVKRGIYPMRIKVGALLKVLIRKFFSISYRLLNIFTGISYRTKTFTKFSPCSVSSSASFLVRVGSS
jgi:hypothetical protein